MENKNIKLVQNDYKVKWFDIETYKSPKSEFYNNKEVPLPTDPHAHISMLCSVTDTHLDVFYRKNYTINEAEVITKVNEKAPATNQI